MADIRRDVLQESVAKLSNQGLKVISFVADITKSSDAQAIVKETMLRFGQVNVLVNSAGIRVESHPDGYKEEHRIIPQSLLWETEESDWDLIINTNLKSVFLCSRAVIPHMLKSDGGGSIINITSGFGRKGGSGRSAYASSKHAVEGLTKSLAIELEPHKIGVNSLYPDGRVNVDGRGGHDPFTMVPPALFLATKDAAISGRSICANRWKEELSAFIG